MSLPFLFFDRDDTLIFDVPYLREPARVILTPGAASALKTLREAGFHLVLVTNQSGLARGKVTQRELDDVHTRLCGLLAAEGAWLDRIYYCPHGPWEHCECRKPATGMLRQACQDFAVDLSRSAVIGDKPSDMEMGRAFGLATIQLRLPGLDKEDAGADFTAHSLPETIPFLRKLLGKNAHSADQHG